MKNLNAIGSRLVNHVDATSKFGTITVNDNLLVAKLPILGAGVGVYVKKRGENRFEIGGVGTNATGTRWLYDTLVVSANLMVDRSNSKAYFELGFASTGDQVLSRMFSVAEYLLALRGQEEGATYDHANAVAMYWSSGVLNFGDWAGPHIVHALTGRQIVQNNRPGVNQRVLYSVGSILGWFKRNNVDVWGSGLMRPFTKDELASRRSLTGIKIHAVRGKNTKSEIEKSLDWEVPAVFGDPALLLPEIYPVVADSKSSQASIAFVPHNTHRSRVGGLPDTVKMVDVRLDVRDVVESIASSRAVVSTSLHGIIVAQAYNVPWVWLDVTDHQLGGNDFKFEDFFSTLDRNLVSRRSITLSQLPNLDLEAVASEATLPKLSIDLNLLRDALPVKVSTKPNPMSALHPAHGNSNLL